MSIGGDVSVGDGQSTAEVAASAVEQAVASGQATVVVKPATPVHTPDEEPMHDGQRIVLGWLMILLPLLLFTQLIALWPAVHAATTSRTAQPKTELLFGLVNRTFSADEALLLLVALAGGLASLAEVSFRFTASAGRGQLSKRWTWSYLLRPVQGAALAVVVYFALRGGLLSVNGGTETLNPYGVAAIAGLVGLFTRQAFQKLKDVFNMLWNVQDLDADVRPRPSGGDTHGQKHEGADPGSGGNGAGPDAGDR